MNRKLNKKGFTIVELVIVIAVVAILAAVLIPTFIGLVNEANVANDTAVAKNMNNALATYSATNGAPESFDEVLDAIEDAGYVLANLNAKANGNFYAWDKANNQIVYVAADGSVIYKNVDFDKANLQFVVANSSVALPDWADATQILDMTQITSVENFKDAVEAGEDVTLRADLAFSGLLQITEDVTIDLNGFKLDASANSSRPFELTEGASLTIKGNDNTVVNCGRFGLVNVPAGVNGSITLDGGVYAGNTDNGSFIKLRDGEGTVNVTLNNVKYTDASDDGYLLNTNGFKGTLKLAINGGEYAAAFGFMGGKAGDTVTINGAKITTQGVAFATAANATITNSEITVTSNIVGGSEVPACVAVQSNTGDLTISDSVLNADGEGSYVYCIYSSGGKIVANNNTENGELFKNTVEGLYSGMDTTDAYLEVDGEVKVDKHYPEEVQAEGAEG